MVFLMGLFGRLSSNKNSNGFKYLDKLIHSGAKKIVLDSDIHLSTFESLKYINGIDVDVDHLEIDGNGHTIDANNKSRIFAISAKHIIIRNIRFINANGTAIFNQRYGDVEIYKCEFKDNFAKENGGAIFNSGAIYLRGCEFLNNSANIGAAIANDEYAILSLVNCNFKENNAYDGALVNNSTASLSNCNFENNSANFGGAISNQPHSDMTIDGGEFKNNNCSNLGGAIVNQAKITLSHVFFCNNVSKKAGGAIQNQEEGIIKLNDCKFISNNSESFGGAIDNQGVVDLVEGKFIDNAAGKCGGAIINWGHVNLNGTIFSNNISQKDGGTIYNVFGSKLFASKSKFINNHADGKGSCIYNDSKKVNLSECEFLQHENGSNVVFNKNSLDLSGCTFNGNNAMDNIIFNDLNSKLSISYGKIINNNISHSTIHNKSQECIVYKTNFDNNVGNMEFGANIYNEGDLTLKSPKISQDCSVLNKSHVGIRDLSDDEHERIIKNMDGGYSENLDKIDEDKLDFSYLDQLIMDNDKINLTQDIVLQSYESEFLTGGISIDKDNVEINGNNHIIDAKGESRIFIITGKNITLRNIIFKNGLSANDFDSHTAGGGAIKISKDSTVKIHDCHFIDNESQDDGGAILNNGQLISKGNEFANNISKYYGGAISNNHMTYSHKDNFKDNNSKIAGAIYNDYQLCIEEIILDNNSSDFNQDIYNADYLEAHYVNYGVAEIIYNTHYINKFINEWESFKYLEDSLIWRSSKEVHITRDIKLTYDGRWPFLSVDGDIIFDGNNHVIDLNNLNYNFQINANVLFKNVTFINGYITLSLFDVNGKAEFENVKFLNNKITSDAYLINNKNKVKIVDSSFCNNSCKTGSLIYNESDLEIIKSEFVNNQTQSSGAVLLNSRYGDRSRVSIKDSFFKSNSSKKDGGAIYNESKLEIVNTEFIKNHSNLYSGAIFNTEGVMDLKNCIFKGNDAHKTGAIWTSNENDLKLKNCSFEDNEPNDINYKSNEIG